MREIVSIVAGVTVTLAWLAVWALVLRAFGIAFFRPRQAQDRAERRERINQLGQLRYILIFGVLGAGLAVGLGLTIGDFLADGSFSWTRAIVKVAFFTVGFGLFQGFRTWSEIRDPLFPPKYPQAK